MEDSTMRLGLLMEAAQANHKLAEASIRKLRTLSAEMANTVRVEVREAVAGELRSLAADSRRAADALHSIRRAANLRVLLFSLATTCLCSAIPFGLALWIIPSKSEIAALRARYSELRSAVAALEESGGRVELRRCGTGSRLCVRVDRSAPAFGEQSDYLVVKGY